MRPCKCDGSAGMRSTLSIQSAPRSGSTLLYGVLLALFPGCLIKKEHFRLAGEAKATKKPKQWALGGPILTPVRDPLDSLASALAMRNNLASSNPDFLRAEMSAITQLFRKTPSGAMHMLDESGSGCSNASHRLILFYEEWWRNPPALVQALESAFRCKVAPAVWSTLPNVFDVQSLYNYTHRKGFKYLRPPKEPSKGWSAEVAGLHPRHISETFGGPHFEGLKGWQQALMCNDRYVQAMRDGCGYSGARCRGTAKVLKTTLPHGKKKARAAAAEAAAAPAGEA